MQRNPLNLGALDHVLAGVLLVLANQYTTCCICVARSADVGREKWHPHCHSDVAQPLRRSGIPLRTSPPRGWNRVLPFGSSPARPDSVATSKIGTAETAESIRPRGHTETRWQCGGRGGENQARARSLNFICDHGPEPSKFAMRTGRFFRIRPR